MWQNIISAWYLYVLLQVIPFDEWPDEFFPTNCWGVVYIMSNFVRNKLLHVFESSDRGIFRVDDVFVTGMLAEKGFTISSDDR